MKRTEPPVNLTSPAFRYTSSVNTDVAKRFAQHPQYAKFLAERQKRREQEARQ